MTRPDAVSPRLSGVGVGFKPQHGDTILAHPPRGAWFEVHPENYMGAGGPRLRQLDAVRQDHEISLHGVGLSLGQAEGVAEEHLTRLGALADRYAPAVVSEHLSFSFGGGRYLNDLAPLPYTEETLDVVAANVQRVQEALKRPILVENPSVYLSWAHNTLSETAFLADLVARTGCGLLLDVNNVFVSATNLGTAPETYLEALPMAAVGEIHLAGHARRTVDGVSLLLDDHGSVVSDPVWALYARTVETMGPVPTLIEWDCRVPPFATLWAEAEKARTIMTRAGRAQSGSLCEPDWGRDSALNQINRL